MKLLRDPLLHFAIAGAVLFAVAGLWTPDIPGARGSTPVTIGEGEMRWLRETFSGQWRRDPTPAEMQDLMATLVDEELLAREARSLGLDQSDTVVRRRLAQKMMFLVEDTSHLSLPGEDELRQFQTDHADRYSSDAQVSFRHLFFSSRRRAPETDARTVLASIQSSSTDLQEGDPLPLEASYEGLDGRAVSRLFGPDFADTIVSLPVGRWSGPVRSAYGQHLVFVTEVRPGQTRRFEDVRAAVLDDWRREKTVESRRAYLARLRDKYGVVVDQDALSRLGHTNERHARP